METDAPERRPLEESLRGLRVIAVDDDLDTVELMAALLRLYGATVRTARSAGEALALLQTWRPHALLSDLQMPQQDGYQLIGHVRELPGYLGSIPAIAITAHHESRDRSRALAAGFTATMAKPFDIVALVDALKQFRPLLPGQSAQT